MAQLKKRLPYNVTGPCFVDSTCIDCDACRWIAPEIFGGMEGHAYVKKNPQTAEELKLFQMGLLSCPVNSIGDQDKRPLKAAMDALPCLIEDNVYFCGFTSQKSYGAQSYFIRDESGNWLVDSPSYGKFLAERFKEMGGLRYIFLSHQDDVADAFEFAAEFKAKIIMHEKDAPSSVGIDVLIKKQAAEIVGPCTIVPTPGHTKGSMCLVYKDRFLFTGDHLFYDDVKKELDVFGEYCWFDFEEQIISVEKLKKFEKIEWVLPGHGGKIKLGPGSFNLEIDRLLEKNKQTYK